MITILMFKRKLPRKSA